MTHELIIQPAQAGLASLLPRLQSPGISGALTYFAVFPALFRFMPFATLVFMKPIRLHLTFLAIAVAVVACHAHADDKAITERAANEAAIKAAGPPKDGTPNQSGALKLVSASWLGGSANDSIVSAAVAPDGSIVLAGNAADLTIPGVTPVAWGQMGTLPAATPPADPDAASQWVHPGTSGFIVRLAPGGQKVLSLARFG